VVLEHHRSVLMVVDRCLGEGQSDVIVHAIVGFLMQKSGTFDPSERVLFQTSRV